MTKIQSGIAAALIGAAVTTSVVQYRTTIRLQDELRQRRQFTAPSPNQLVAKVARVNGFAFDGPNEDLADLQRLRGEVTVLRRRIREMSSFKHSTAELEEMRNRLGGFSFPIERVPGTPFARNRYYPREIWFGRRPRCS